MGNNPIILSHSQVVQHFVNVSLHVHDFDLIVTSWPDSSLSHIVITPCSHFHVQALVRVLQTLQVTLPTELRSALLSPCPASL